MAVIWTEDALADLERIFLFVFESSPQNALLVDDRIEAHTQLLSSFPRLGTDTGHEGIRQLSVDRAPYRVLYRLHDDDVIILRVVSERS